MNLFEKRIFYLIVCGGLCVFYIIFLSACVWMKDIASNRVHFAYRYYCMDISKPSFTQIQTHTHTEAQTNISRPITDITIAFTHGHTDTHWQTNINMPSMWVEGKIISTVYGCYCISLFLFKFFQDAIIFYYNHFKNKKVRKQKKKMENRLNW